MFLLLFEMITNSSLMTTVVWLVELYAMQKMKTLKERVDTFGAGPTPDARMGFTLDELNQWYQDLGGEGRQAYLQMAAFDFFPFIQVTPILLGTFLYTQLTAAGMSPLAAMIMPAAMLGDLIETYIVVHGCKNYPNEILPTEYVEMASLGNQLKWVAYASGLVLLSGLFVYNRFRVKKLKNE